MLESLRRKPEKVQREEEDQHSRLSEDPAFRSEHDRLVLHIATRTVGVCQRVA